MGKAVSIVANDEGVIIEMDKSELEPNNNNDSLRERERKPHNYYNDLSETEKEELAKMDAAAAEVNRGVEMRKNQNIFGRIGKSNLTFENGNGDGDGDGESKRQQEEDDEEELASIRLTKDDIDFMFPGAAPVPRASGRSSAGSTSPPGASSRTWWM